MPLFKRCLAFLAGLCAPLVASPSRADFIATGADDNGMPVVARLRDDGQVARFYDVEWTDRFAISLGGLGPDGNVYLIATDYPATGGPSTGVVRFSPRTGEFLDSVSSPFTGSAKIAGLTSAHRVAFAPNGDVFLLGAGPDPDGSDYGLSQVHRIDRETGLSKSVYSKVEPYGYSDIEVRPAAAGSFDAEVYITEGYGWLTRWLSSDVDESAPGSLPARGPTERSWIGQSFARTMEFGPDGDLYFRTDVNGVWRFDVDTDAGSMLIDSLPNPFQPNIISLGGNVTFGPGGDLFLLRHGTYGSLSDWHSVVYRVDGTTGALLGTALDAAAAELGAIGELLYLPVPEPSGIVCIAVGISLLTAGRPQKRCQEPGKTG